MKARSLSIGAVFLLFTATFFACNDDPGSGSACSYNSDCASHEICIDGHCQGECRENRDCTDGRCVDGACVDDRISDAGTDPTDDDGADDGSSDDGSDMDCDSSSDSSGDWDNGSSGSSDTDCDSDSSSDSSSSWDSSSDDSSDSGFDCVGDSEAAPRLRGVARQRGPRWSPAALRGKGSGARKAASRLVALSPMILLLLILFVWREIGSRSTASRPWRHPHASG